MNRYGNFDERIVFMVHVYARRLFQRGILRSMDLEDMEQDFMFEVIKSIGNYNSSLCSLHTFLEQVIKNRTNKLLRSSFRLKRGAGTVKEEYIDGMIDSRAEIDIDKMMDLADLDKALLFLSPDQRTLCELARKYTLSEISKILGVNRSTLYSRFKVITRIIKNICSQNPSRLNSFLPNKEFYMKNISVLETLTAKEISRLDTADLMDLNEQMTNLNIQVKEMRQKLEDGLSLKYEEAVKNNLSSEGKDTGTTRFFDGSHQIIAEIQKKVTWDSEKMEGIVKQIPDDRRRDLIKITYAVDERKYLALPSEYRQLFKEARTVTPGKTRFQIQLGDQQ